MIVLKSEDSLIDTFLQKKKLFVHPWVLKYLDTIYLIEGDLCASRNTTWIIIN